MADEHGVAGGSNDHTEHGEPDVWHALRRLSSISNAQHVAHGLKEGKGIELAPWVILLEETEGGQRDGKRKYTLELKYTQGGGELLTFCDFGLWQM